MGPDLMHQPANRVEGARGPWAGGGRSLNYVLLGPAGLPGCYYPQSCPLPTSCPRACKTAEPSPLLIKYIAQRLFHQRHPQLLAIWEVFGSRLSCLSVEMPPRQPPHSITCYRAGISLPLLQTHWRQISLSLACCPSVIPL